MTPSARATYIADLLEEHFEELDHLWCRRAALLENPRSSSADLASLDERIEAHRDGLLVAGEALASVCGGRLARPTAGEVFTAAWALLSSDHSDCANLVIDCLPTAEGPQLDGLLAALLQGPIRAVQPRLEALVVSAPAPTAAAAALVLAAHGKRLDPDRLSALATDASPNARRLAWQAVARVRS